MTLANPEIDCHSRHFRNPYLWTAQWTSAKLSQIDTWERSDSLFGLKLKFLYTLSLNYDTSPVLGDIVGDNTVYQKSYSFNTSKTIQYIDQYGKDTASGFRFYYTDMTYVDVGPINLSQPVFRTTIDTLFLGMRCVFQKRSDTDATIMGVFACNAYQHLYTFQQPIPDFTQALGKFYPQYTWSTTQKNCSPSISETFSVSLTKNGTLISFPSWFVFSQTSGTLMVDTMFSSGISKSDVGIYSLKIAATLFSGLFTVQETIQMTSTITILSDCSYATQISGTIVDMNCDVGFEYTQLLVYTDNISTLHGDPLYCDKTYTITTPAAYDWTSATPPTFHVLSNDPALIGQIKNVNIVVTLVDAPQVNPKNDALRIHFFDPCDDIQFIADPSPLLTDITITMPTTTVQTFNFMPNLKKFSPTHNVMMPQCAHDGRKLGPSQLTFSAPFESFSINPALFSLPNDVGSYSCEIEVKSLSPKGTSLVTKFTLYILCPITQILFSPVIPDYKQYIGGLSVTTSSYGFTQVNACNYPITWSTIAKPTFVSYDINNKLYKSQCTNLSQRGVYTITTHAEMKERDPITGLDWTFSSEFSFQLKILVDGCKTTVLSGTFNAMAYVIGNAASVQPLTFSDSFSTTKSIPGLCGQVVVSFSPADFYMSYDGTQAVLITNDVSVIGLHSVTLTTRLVDYPEAAPLLLTNDVNITCNLGALSFTTTPSVTEYRVGITPEPLIHEEYTVAVCGATPTYSLTWISPTSYAGPGTFTEIPGIIKFGLSLAGLARADHGLYQFSLSASIPLMPIATTTFSILVINPCSETSYDTATSPVVDMTFNIGDSPLTQTTNVRTLLFLSTALQCKTTLTLSPSSSFVSLSGTQITVDQTGMTPTSIGLHTFTLTVTLNNWPTVTASYSFNVNILCTITSLTPTPALTTASHALYQNPYSPTVIPMPVFAITPAICSVPLQFTFIDAVTGLPVTELSLASSSVVIDAQVALLAGSKTYKIVATATLTAFLAGLSNTADLTVTYTLCETNNVLVPVVIPNQTFVPSHPPEVATIMPFTDAVSSFYATPGMCGPISYAIAPSVTIVQITQPPDNSAGPKLTIWTDDMTLVGTTLSFTISATLVNYPGVLPVSATLNVIITNPCLVTKLEPSMTFTDMSIVVGESPMTASFAQFTDTEARALNQPQLCGERVYSLSSIATLIKPDDPWTKPWQFVLSTNDASLVGDHIVTLQASLLDYPTVAPTLQTFNVRVEKQNVPPYFAKPVKETLIIQKELVSKGWSEKLPLLADNDSSQILTLKAEMGFATQFVDLIELTSGKEYSLSVSNISSKSVIPGYYPVTLKVSDGKATATYQTLILVFDVVPPVVQVETPLEQVEVEMDETEPQKLGCEFTLETPQVQEQVEYISGSSPLKVMWKDFILLSDKECESEGIPTISIEVSSQWNDNRFILESEWLQYTQSSVSNSNNQNYFVIRSSSITGEPFTGTVLVNAKALAISASFVVKVTIKPTSKPTSITKSTIVPVLRLKEIQMSGLVVIEVNTPIMIYDDPNDAFMQFPDRFLKFKVLKNSQSADWEDPNYVNSGEITKVEVKSFTTEEIRIQLEIQNAIYVSHDTFHRDSLQMTVLDETAFVSLMDLLTTTRRRSTSQIEIFRLLSPDLVGSVETMQKQAQASNALLASSLPINLLLGVSLKFLWGMVNSLQFIVFMDQWQVNWPANADVAISTIRQVALGEFIDTEMIKDKLGEFFGFAKKNGADQEEAQETQKRQLQDKPKVRIDRLVLTIIGAVALVALISLFAFYSYKTNLCGSARRYLVELKRKMFWNFFIRSYLQTILKWWFGCALFFSQLKLQEGFKASKGTEVFYGLQIFVLVLGVPALFVYLLKKHRQGLYLKETKQQYGSLYLGVRLQGSLRIYLVIEMLLVKFFFVVITTCLYKVPGILVNTYMFLNNIHVIYIGLVEPYEEKSQQRIELINAWMLHMCAYAILLLANLMCNPKQEINVGWAIIGLIGLLFLVNFGNIVLLTVGQAYQYLRLRYIKYQAAKRMKDQENERQLAKQRSIAEGAEVKDVRAPNMIEAVFKVSAATLNQLEAQSPVQNLLDSRKSGLLQNKASIKIGEDSNRVDQSLARLSELIPSPSIQSSLSSSLTGSKIDANEDKQAEGLKIIEDLEIQSIKSRNLPVFPKHARMETTSEWANTKEDVQKTQQTEEVIKLNKSRENASSIAVKISSRPVADDNKVEDAILQVDNPNSYADTLLKVDKKDQITTHLVAQSESLVELSSLQQLRFNVQRRNNFFEQQKQTPTMDGLIQLPRRNLVDPNATDLASRMARIDDLFKEERKKLAPDRWHWF